MVEAEERSHDEAGSERAVALLEAARDVAGPGRLLPEVAEQRQNDEAQEEGRRDGREVAGECFDRGRALHDDRSEQQGGRRTEQGNQVPLQADADVADLSRETPRGSRTVDDPGDNEGQDREQGDAEKAERAERDVGLEDPEPFRAQQRGHETGPAEPVEQDHERRDRMAGDGRAHGDLLSGQWTYLVSAHPVA